MADKEVITVDAKRWYKAEAALAEKHTEGAEHFKKGEFGKGLFTFAGAWAPLVAAGTAGAVLFALADWKQVREISLFKKHWSLRGLAILLAALGLWWKGMKQAAAAFASTAAAILVADWKAYRAEGDAKDARIKQGIAAAMGGEAKGPDGDTGYWLEGRWMPYRWEERRERAAERQLLEQARWDEALAARRAAEEEARRRFVPAY